MRPITLVILATICIVIVSYRSISTGSSHQSKGKAKAVVAKVVKGHEVKGQEVKGQEVKGQESSGSPIRFWTNLNYGPTVEDAKQLAIDEGQRTLEAKLRRCNLKWTPSLDFVEQHISGDPKIDPNRIEIPGKAGDPGTSMIGASFLIEVSDSDYQEILNADRQVRRDNNQIFLARILAMLVTICAAISGYLRLDDATKGYYTNMLRLGSLALVAVVGGGLWLVA
ncbi:MAG TPA: hypothetical protein VGZ25_16095 [Gemmataceae bacterium]|jgi:hypothetical protein|nr:hypothetical protein [Gemmataceae bacterium]